MICRLLRRIVRPIQRGLDFLANLRYHLDRGHDFLANLRYHLDRGHDFGEAIERARRTLP